jgi:hypothetical protein
MEILKNNLRGECRVARYKSMSASLSSGIADKKTASRAHCAMT